MEDIAKAREQEIAAAVEAVKLLGKDIWLFYLGFLICFAGLGLPFLAILTGHGEGKVPAFGIAVVLIGVGGLLLAFSVGNLRERRKDPATGEILPNREPLIIYVFAAALLAALCALAWLILEGRVA